MEQDQMHTETPSYWNSVLLGGLITAVIYSVLGVLSSYVMLKNPTAGQSLGIFVCLLGAIAGVIANRHYAKENNITYSLGKGALIGFLAGVVAVLIGSIISYIWTSFVDPGLNEALYQSQITQLEQSGMTQEQIDAAMAFSPKPGSTAALLWGLGMGIVGMGIINVISGIISAKIFASEE